MENEIVYPEQLKIFIKNLIKICRDEILHDEYNITIAYSKVPHSEDGRWTTTFTVDINHIYLWAKVTVYPATLEDWNNKEYKKISGYILHEICHLFLHPVSHLFMWDASASQKEHFKEVIERQTQRICNSILRSWPEDWWEKHIP